MDTKLTKINELIQKIVSQYNQNSIISVDSQITQAVATSLNTKSSSGAPLCRWSREELISKIWQSVVLLEHNGQKVNQSNVLRLLGFDKSTIYKRSNNVTSIKVSSEINQIIEYNLELKINKKDPTFTEHIQESMGLSNLGSKPIFEDIQFSNNQLILSLLLQPIFLDSSSFILKIGTNEDEIEATELIKILLMKILIDNKWFHGRTSSFNIDTYTGHLINAISHVISRGRIHSNNVSFDYLQRHDKKYKFAELIERYGSYTTGMKSYQYKLTNKLLVYITQAVQSLELFNIEVSTTDNIKESDLIISNDIFYKLHPRDIFLMFSYLSGVDSQGNYIIKNSQTIIDRQESRVYSLFTSLKSETRKQIGFINYDISTCMQTIVSHFVDMKKYPLHKQLITNKRLFRNRLSKELDKDINKVKEMISAADNGKKYSDITYLRSEMFKEYVDETEPIVDEFIDYFEQHNEELIRIAKIYAKREFEIIDWVKVDGYEKKQPKFVDSGFKKYSIFFFIWTQIEREIRYAMMSCFTEYVHQVHDAVYSKQNVDIEILVKVVEEQTGLKVKIEN